MPKIEQTICDINTRAHTFRFVSPAEGGALKMPKACNVCHTDKASAWATAVLKTWTALSPWRVAQSADRNGLPPIEHSLHSVGVTTHVKKSEP
jgi:hypothetical protein